MPAPTRSWSRSVVVCALLPLLGPLSSIGFVGPARAAEPDSATAPPPAPPPPPPPAPDSYVGPAEDPLGTGGQSGTGGSAGDPPLLDGPPPAGSVPDPPDGAGARGPYGQQPSPAQNPPLTAPAAPWGQPPPLDAPPLALGRLPIAPTLTGPVGLLRTSSAEVGPLHQLRVGLRGEYFSADGFLIERDSNQRLTGGLAIGFTLRPNLELFGALLNSSNRNRRVRDVSDRDPELIKTFGDLILGAKWIHSLGAGTTLGAELGLKFLSGVSELSVSPSSTSWWLGPILTTDLRRVNGIPLRFHANASYYADNSKNLYDLSGLTRNTKAVAMFAYGIAPSRLQLALAVDVPLDGIFPGFPLDPFIEYHASYVTSDADKDFSDYMAPNCGGSDPGRMPCLDNRDLQWLTIGARADVYRGVTVDLGVDVRIRSPGFPFGPPVAPWNLMFGVSYPLDIDALRRPVVVIRNVPPPQPAEGQVVGTVRNARDGAAIGGAIVAVVGRPRARAASDPDGGFATPPLPLGPVELEATAPDFETARVATVVTGAPVDLALALKPNPPAARVYGRIVGPADKGVEASVRFAGSENREVRADASGAYSVSLPLGSYQMRVESPGLGSKEIQVDLLGAGQDRQLDFVLRVPSTDPNVVLTGQAIKLKQPVRFVGFTAKLQPASQTLLNGVADLLDVHGDIKSVRIEAHWDNSLPKPRSATLTQEQAEAVKAYLVGRGIAAARLAAVGLGATKPVVPNLTPMNRARNRRVELHLE